MMYAKDFRQLAWQRLSGQWGTMVLIYFLYSLINGVLSYIFIGSLLFSGALMIGMCSATLSLLRYGRADLEQLFDGFRLNLPNAIVASILYSLFIALWSMLFVIPGIIKTYSYAMTFSILHDNPNMSASDAITESRRMMDGHKFRLFCLQLSFFGWILLGIITFGIAMLFVAPYMQTAQAAFYEDLKARQAPRDYFAQV